jgi:hypothetical protein
MSGPDRDGTVAARTFRLPIISTANLSMKIISRQVAAIPNHLVLARAEWLDGVYPSAISSYPVWAGDLPKALERLEEAGLALQKSYQANVRFIECEGLPAPPLLLNALEEWSVARCNFAIAVEMAAKEQSGFKFAFAVNVLASGQARRVRQSDGAVTVYPVI